VLIHHEAKIKEETMAKNLKKRLFVLIYCIAFFLPVFLSVSAGAATDGWLKLLGTVSYEVSYGVATDSSGNIYVTGETSGDLGNETNAGGSDIFLAKYDGSGTRQWVRLLGTASHEVGCGVATDSSGNIYVTGETKGDLGGETNEGGRDIFLARYDGSGTRQWVKLLGTASNDYGLGVATDASGNIYVTGETSGDLGGETNKGGRDVFLARYDGSGTRQWVKLLGTASHEVGCGVATDSSGTIYVTGETWGNLGGETNAGQEDIFLARYDRSGTRQWVKLLGTASHEVGCGVATDASGTIYVTGETWGDLGGETYEGLNDIFLARYDGSGTRQWVKLLGTASYDYGCGVTTDSFGNIYVTGVTSGDLGGETYEGLNDIFLARYDGSGTRQWVKLLGTASNDYGCGVATDASGTVYVTGYTKGNLGGETNEGLNDIFLSRYDGSDTR
jgi:hypothetical protein